MDLLSKYNEFGLEGLKQSINNLQTKDEAFIRDLKHLLKEKDIKHDIDALKFVAHQFYQVEKFEDAQKLSKKILMRKPNDEETQQLLLKIRQNNQATSSKEREKPVSILEKNQILFRKIEKVVNNLVVGQEKLIRYLSLLVQKSLVAENNLKIYKDAMLIASPKSQGVKTTVEAFFQEVAKKKLLDNGEIKLIDLSSYQTNDNPTHTFYIDIYNAFQSKSCVTLFQNVDQCPIDLIHVMNSLLNDGYVPLDGRYLYQDGAFMEVNQMLVEGSFNTIQPTDQYLIFHTNETMEKGLHIFTEPSQANLSYKLELNKLKDSELQLLLELFMESYIEKANKNLGLDIEFDSENLLPFALYHFNREGADGLQNGINKVYEGISGVCLEQPDFNYQSRWKVALDQDNVLNLRNDSTSYKLFPLYKNRDSVTHIEQQIEQLIGLQEVKNALQELKSYMKLREMKMLEGNDIGKQSLHFVFKGNPGTGKTTVARMIAQYLKSIGYLEEGQLIEVDRTGLVGKYIGHTAVQTNNKVKAALGGVLFIDEAYGLSRGDENDFGREAIDTIVKAMEDYREKLVIIFAGYPKEMDDFLDSNQGLRSRVSQEIYFSDYSVEELMLISNKIVKDKGYQIEDSVIKPLQDYYKKHQIKGKIDNGNGRLVRQTIENAIRKQAARIMSNNSEGHSNLLTITDYGFDQQESFDLEEELDKIIGLDNVKQYIHTLQKQVTINKKREAYNIDFSNNQSLHFIFTGNPGTGKTTIARLISQLMKNMDILKKGHLVEVSRTDLVAGYVGQTAIKTEKMFKQALGGILFIDEAYTLANDQFGEESIHTLIKLMEDYKDDIIIIMAGYQKEMNKLLEINPGLRSRFNTTFHFEDYSNEELLNIATQLFKYKRFQLTSNAQKTLHQLITDSHINEGNGRFVRNLVEEIIRIQATRLYDLDLKQLEEEDLLNITSDDIMELMKKYK